MDVIEKGIVDELDSIYELLDNMEHIVGDVPVSLQLSEAINRLAEKAHFHDCYVRYEEFDALKQEVDRLSALVGDISVSEQISAVLKG